MSSFAAQWKTAKGVAGRMVGSLEALDLPYSAGLYSVHGSNARILHGARTPPDVIGASLPKYAGGDFLGMSAEQIQDVLTRNTSSSLLSDSHAGLLEAALHRTTLLAEELEQPVNDPTVTFAQDDLSKHRG